MDLALNSITEQLEVRLAAAVATQLVVRTAYHDVGVRAGLASNAGPTRNQDVTTSDLTTRVALSPPGPNVSRVARPFVVNPNDAAVMVIFQVNTGSLIIPVTRVSVPANAALYLGRDGWRLFPEPCCPCGSSTPAAGGDMFGPDFFGRDFFGRDFFG